MSNPDSSNRTPAYVKITDDQRKILSDYFDKGMIGTGQKHDALVTQASTITNLPKNKVKKWIGNESRKRKQAVSGTDEGPCPKKVALPSFKRGQTQYNAFCAMFFKEECCKGLPLEAKNKMASLKWKTLTPEEKETYKEVAITKKNIDLNSLTKDDQEKITKSFIKQIADQVSFLGSIGCTVSMLILSPSGNLLGAGTEDGQDFFATNPDVVLKFRQHFDHVFESFTYRDVMNLFNLKYSEAVGRPSRVPYLKGDFEVVGLPEGIGFRKPYTYGKRQVNAIMASKDDIKFIITDGNSDDDTMTPVGQLSNTLVCQKQVLTKLVGENEASIALANQAIITEDKVEVMDLTLSQSERLVLYNSCMQFFDVDAWCAVGKNMQHESASTGIILPIYNVSDEPYWLFYFPRRLEVVLKANPGTKLSGYWLDISGEESERKYQLIPEESSIVGKNVIKTDHGALYYINDTKLSAGVIWQIPPIFHDTILTVLNLKLFSSSG